MSGLDSPLLAVMYLYPKFKWQPERFRRALRSQNKLLACAKKLYPEHIVKYNYLHPDMRFSGSDSKMELDVFLPEPGLAFEYQGEQHFHPIQYYGGEKTLKTTQIRDAEKRLACAAKNITLIEVPYTWDRSEAELQQMIEAGPGAAIPPS